MNENLQLYLTTGEFAKFFNIPKKTLFYYNDIGLFCPEIVKKNGYRYYSYKQLYTFEIILSFKRLGMSLKEIKNYLENRTPETMLELFEKQIDEIDERIKKLQQINMVIRGRIKLLEKAMAIPIDQIQVVYCEEELLAISPLLKGSNDKEGHITWHNLFSMPNLQGNMENYIYGHIIKKTKLEAKDITPNYIFVKLSGNIHTKNVIIKPKGKYIIGYQKGDIYNPKKLYNRLFNFMKEKKMKITGNAYEVILIDDSLSKKDNEHLLQVCIQVK
ncbi:MerR family transcriptional regulator [Clostridium tetani]|uniref:MerR family transcriptional regulator n=1 Tax=Clostridium tetani TaxID=1513 RepID=UPI00100BFDC5|nr:MerR family transcriptional regulator [Clostridium tetani]RXM58355.1 multidrug transporter [Clostridium tetani]RXM78678.1 multidrug transporter [Clostridium tetani]RYU99722.1 multidrug transporter [Clostridium tetani]